MKLDILKFKRFNELNARDINFDFHIHTSQTDGKNTAEEMIHQSKKLDLESIAFTEHVNEQTNWFREFKQYITELRNLEYNKNINILIGIEVKPIDFGGNLSATDEIIQNSEIVVGSVHSYSDGKGGLISLKNIPTLGEERAAETEFKLARGLLQNPNVDIIGHPFGVYSKFFNKFQDGYLKELMKESLRKDKAIEINTKYNLNEKFFNLLRKVNPYVSIGSDAHSKNEIARFFDIIKYEILK